MILDVLTIPDDEAEAVDDHEAVVEDVEAVKTMVRHVAMSQPRFVLSGFTFVS